VTEAIVFMAINHKLFVIQFKRKKMEKETIHYWRDKVTTVLQWGSGFFVLFAGYAISNYKLFKVGTGLHENFAGIGLLFMTALYAFVFPFVIHKIYQLHLKYTAGDTTILPKKYAMVIAFTMVILTTTLSLLLVFVRDRKDDSKLKVCCLVNPILVFNTSICGCWAMT
jgi:vacuolar-type H+-ATPase subunit I/STV1